MAKMLERVESELPKIKGIDHAIPLKFELEIQRQRVLYILHNAIKKIKIMACLPEMLRDDCKLLRSYLDAKEVDFIRFVCAKYNVFPRPCNIDLDVFRSLRPIDRIKLRRYRNTYMDYEEYKVDYHVAKMIEIVTTNADLVRFIGANLTPTDTVIGHLLNNMKHLKHLIHEKLLVTNEEQKIREDKLRAATKGSSMLTREIANLQQQIEKQRQEFNVEFARKKAILEAEYVRKNKLLANFQETMNNTVIESEQQMMVDSYDSDVRRVELERDYQKILATYQKQLDDDLNEEKKMRQKRNKIEAQLASWVFKYDTDITEKQTQLDELQKIQDDAKAEMEILQRKIDEEDEMYQILMVERDAEDDRLDELRALEFLKNRSARRIQRCFREYLERKRLRKRKKKGKGKGKGKGKKGKKGPPPPEKEKTRTERKDDIGQVLEQQFKKKGHVFEELDTTKEFKVEPPPAVS